MKEMENQDICGKQQGDRNRSTYESSLIQFFMLPAALIISWVGREQEIKSFR
jgi:hypothetical protein